MQIYNKIPEIKLIDNKKFLSLWSNKIIDIKNFRLVRLLNQLRFFLLKIYNSLNWKGWNFFQNDDNKIKI